MKLVYTLSLLHYDPKSAARFLHKRCIGMVIDLRKTIEQDNPFRKFCDKKAVTWKHYTTIDDIEDLLEYAAMHDVCLVGDAEFIGGKAADDTGIVDALLKRGFKFYQFTEPAEL